MFWKKKIFLVAFGFGLLLLTAGCTVSNGLTTKVSVNTETEKTTSTSAIVSAPLRIYFLDVGQGDSVLIATPEQKYILVDGGPGDAVLAQLGKVLPYNQKKIDTIILTHPHADHLEGLIPVLRRYQVEQIFYSGVPHTTDEFLEWLRLIKEKGIALKKVDHAFVLDVGAGVAFEFLYPFKDLTIEKSVDKNLNNTSVVFRLVYGQTSILFTGDAENPAEEDILKQHPKEKLKSNAIKVGHHGSKTSSGEDFIKAVAPQMAIISAGKDNDYGHPHLRTLRRLERLGIKIYRTDQIGLIELQSNGQTLQKK